MRKQLAWHGAAQHSTAHVYAAACFVAVHEPDAVHKPNLCQQQDDSQEGVEAQADAVVASRTDQPCGRCDEGEQPGAEEGIYEPICQQPHIVRETVAPRVMPLQLLQCRFK